jgi:hypothetical protein
MLNTLFMILAFLAGVLVTYVAMNKAKKKTLADLWIEFRDQSELDFKSTFNSAYDAGVQRGRYLEFLENARKKQTDQ